MALSSNALCAKAKAMYGYRLNEESYSDLCRKQTLGEMDEELCASGFQLTVT